METIQLGKYKHYKGNHYEVIGTAIHSETLEIMVLYKALYDSHSHPAGTIWVRSLKMFSETVLVDGEEVNRFDFIG